MTTIGLMWVGDGADSPPPGLLSRAAVRCRGSLHGRLITSVSRRCGLVLVRIDTNNALMVANQLRVATGSTIM